MTDNLAIVANSSQVQPQVNVCLLDDHPVDVDAFGGTFGGHRRVARAIAGLITKEDGGKAIALEGGWGSGKSSVIRMLARELEQDDVKLLVFDAWSHEGDPLRRVFLETLTAMCFEQFDENTKEKWERRKKSEITGRARETDQMTTPVLKSKWPILVAAGATLYPVALVSLGGLLRHGINEWIFGLIVFTALIALAPAVWFLYLFGACRGETKAQLARVGRLILPWSKKIDESTLTTAHETLGPTTMEFQAYFSDIVNEYLAESTRRLVIVLDNLDRVPESTARVLWSTLRLFSDCCENGKGTWSRQVWFVVPYDRVSAANLWETEGERGGDRDRPEEQKLGKIVVKPPSISAAFLDKAFQIRFGVPPLHIADWEKYLKDELLKKAMPGLGSDEERHRVYRLSERLSDEKGRAPSPRHLKLYVNDIGALVRQFSNRFPLDHLALYALLRRQSVDIPLWVRSGKFKSDPLARVMPDELFIESLLAIYFGTDDAGRAKTLTLSAPLRSALRNGDGEQLRQLAKVPGFWSVAQVELEKPLEAEDAKQEVIVNLAKALNTSKLNGAAPPEYTNVIPAFSEIVLQEAEWVQLNNESAEGAGILLQLAKSANTTKVTFSRLISGEEPAQPSVGADAQAWASGTARMVDVARSLGHLREISIPGEPPQVVKCLAAIGSAGFPEDVLESLRCKCSPAELQTAVAPTAAEEWPLEQAAAVRLLLSTPQITIDWKELVNAISARLQVADIASPECIRLLEAMFNLHDCAREEMSAAIGSVVQNASYYVHVNAYRKDAKSIAWLLAAIILGKQVRRPPASETEKKGHEFLNALFTAADETDNIGEELLSIIMARPQLALFDGMIDQHDKLGAFGIKKLTELAQRDDVGKVLPAVSFVEKFGTLNKLLGEKIALLATNTLKSGSFKDQLKALELKVEHAAAHCVLVTAGALHDSGYQEKVFGGLEAIDKDVWLREIENPTDLSKLLVLAIDNGFAITSRHLADAFQEVGQLLCGDKPPEIKWTEKPSDLNRIYGAIDQHQRSTAADRIVDQLANYDMPPGLALAVSLFSDDLTKAFAKRDHESLVRRIAEPIVKSDNLSLMRWLGDVIQCDQRFWNAAPAANQSTFAKTLSQRLNDQEADEIKKQLQEIARLLDLRQPEPEPSPDPATTNAPR